MSRNRLPRILALVGLVLLIGGCGANKEEATTERVLAVRADVLKARDLELGLTYTGSLEGERQAVLYSKLAETVDSLWVKEDDRVKAGQIILSLDETGPSSKFREARSTFENAEKTYKKMKFLYEQGAISEVEFDNAELAYDVARADFDAVKQLVEIESPIAGIVTAIDVRPGEQVNVGTRLATVATTKTLRVRFGVNPEEIGFFTIGAPIKVNADGVADTVNGTITTVSSSADPVTRTFQVEATVDNANGVYRPGMFVRARYIRDHLTDVIAVPRRAVIQLDNTPTVFAVVDGRADRRRVTLGSEIDGLVIVSEGLAVGDTLVTLGQDYLEDSVKVKISELGE